MNATATAIAAPAVRPGYDPDAAATARRVLPMLAEERVVWLSTVRPDGTPHLVPTWFLWDGEALVVWSKPSAVKVRNLRANARLMVAVGDPHADFNVGLIEAAATLAEPAANPVPDAFFAKYASELGAVGLDARTFRATYTQAIRIRPTRFVAWHGRRTPAVAAEPARGHEIDARPAPRLAVMLAGWLDRLSARLRGLGADPTAHMGAPLAA
jgi:PPOX class probable F420-dependent enzyme